MSELLLKLIKKEKITKKDIEEFLYEMCDNEHGSCNFSCLVYDLNNCEIPYKDDSQNCICFKNGHKMLEFIKEKIK
jgi:hypothetical protein